VLAYSERLKLLEELENLKKSPPEKARQQVLLAEFSGSPPYSALRVDALRDEYDALRERQQSLASTERALEKLKVGRIDAQRRAGEAVRLAEDKLARASAQEAIDKERLSRELASLRRQLAEAELANIEIGLERIPRMERQLDRWLDDFGFTARTTSADDWQLGALQLAQTLKSIWNFEMFAVEDSTVIDGKTVTVTYGVTVGKSIGALLLSCRLLAVRAALAAPAASDGEPLRGQRANGQRDSPLGDDLPGGGADHLHSQSGAHSLTVFAFMGGALAIGIGFGTQTIIKNVISGIIILFERKIRVGDIIALAA
jgi:potassium efflux system protein